MQKTHSLPPEHLRNNTSTYYFIRTLDYTLDINNPEPIHFTEQTGPNQPDFEWRTGGNTKDEYDDIED